MSVTLHLRLGECVEVLKGYADASIGAVVSDPPYHLTSIVDRFGKEGAAPSKVPEGGSGVYARSSRGFMGQTWDGTGIAFSDRLWDEVYRVLVPGGMVKAFSGSRTFHRMGAAMQRAGFTSLGVEAWSYGSGFPKSKNIGLFIDKAAKATGDRGRAIPTASLHFPGEGRYSTGGEGEKLTSNPVPPYAPVTDEARTWNGWGTALKPAWEPVLVGRKPLS